ncbi:MAG: hypothetical protein CMF29_00445, partial [Kiritimatiellaceae bacterium]|nr:hypothetical protein [Kiritimatiellaceae bacterium]
MHLLLDSLTALVLLLFFWSGWINGTRISLLRMLQVIIALIVGFVAGRYFGNWIGEWANRPRIVTIPTFGLFSGTLAYFIFHVIISNLIDQREIHLKAIHPLRRFIDRIGGFILSTLSALIIISALFWSSNLLFALTKGTPLPGAEKSIGAQQAEALIYQTVCRTAATQNEAHHAVALANTLSKPAKTIALSKTILEATSIQQLLNDPMIGADLLSGNAARIQQNPALKKLFSDRKTLNHIRQIGLLTGKETQTSICQQLALIGANPTIRTALS